MASLATYAKKVLEGADEVPAVSASLNHGGDVLDVTEMDTNAGYRTRLLGLRDWSMSISAIYDSSNAALSTLRAAWLDRTNVTMHYRPNGTAGFQGAGKVESFDLSGDVGGTETVDIVIQGNAALAVSP